MSEMIERVCRAICIANGDDPDQEHIVCLSGMVMSFGQYEKQWVLIQPLGCAAIEAMRDHTEAMLDAGTQALWPPNDLLPGSAAVAAYRAMIDAALKP